jgi:hypothetical protein
MEPRDALTTQTLSLQLGDDKSGMFLSSVWMMCGMETFSHLVPQLTTLVPTINMYDLLIYLGRYPTFPKDCL